MRYADAAVKEWRRKMKTSTEKRREDLLLVRRSDPDGAILWIDDATGKIVDRSSRPEPQTAPYEVAPPGARRRRQHPGIEAPWRPVRDVRPAFIDLVGPRSSVTMEDGARAERTRLSARVVRLLPARGGGS
jgi:hypothetical protein